MRQSGRVDGAAGEVSSGQRQVWIRRVVAGLAAAISVAALVVAIVGRHRDRGDAPTLRPMAADESMSDEQAYAVASNTVRVWMREHDAKHLANVEALSCPETHDGILDGEITALKNGDFISTRPITAIARFTRAGSVWTLDVFHTESHGEMVTLQVRNGELLVCQIGSAPVP